MHKSKASISAFFFLIMPLISLAIFYFSELKVDSVYAALQKMSPSYLVMGATLAVLPWFTNIYRLHLWAKHFGYALKFRQYLRTVLGAEIAASITPTAIGGTPVKIGLLIKHGLPSGTAFSIISLCGIEDIIFFGTTIPIIFFLKWEILPLPLKLALRQLTDSFPYIVILFSGIYTLRFNISTLIASLFPLQRFWLFERIIQKVRIYRTEILAYYRIVGSEGKHVFIKTLPITALQWFSRYSILTILIVGAGENADFLMYFLLQWSIFTLGAFIPTPGGSGGLEALCFLMFFAFLPTAQLTALVLIWRILSFYLLLTLDIAIILLLTVRQKTAISFKNGILNNGIKQP